MFRRKPNFLNQLAASLQENDVWRNLAQVTSDVINEVVSEPRWALQRVRESDVIQRGDWIDTPAGEGQVTLVRRVRSNINKSANTYDFQDFVEIEINAETFATLPVQVLQDRETMINASKNLGFDYFSATLQDDDYARIVSYVSKFWNNDGGPSFVDFMGMIKRTRFDIGQLWTEAIGDPGQPSFGQTPANSLDPYANFVSYSEYLPKMWESLNFNPLLTADQTLPGTYYPTSHVELAYDILEHSNLDKLDTISLFYLLAPIHLVMQRFADTIFVSVDYAAGVAPLLYTIQEKSLKIEL